MAGSKEGGIKTREAVYKKYGPDYYRNIGKTGGQNGRGPDYKGGFASNRELASTAGAKGGRISRRGPAKRSAI